MNDKMVQGAGTVLLIIGIGVLAFSIYEIIQIPVLKGLHEVEISTFLTMTWVILAIAAGMVATGIILVRAATSN